MIACSRPADSSRAVTMEHQISPEPARVGPVEVTLRLMDAAGKAVPGAHIALEADMSHAGMSPVFDDTREIEPGRYQAHLRFEMAGDWVILLHVDPARRTEVGTPDQCAGGSTQLGKLLNPSSIPALEAPEALPFDLMRVPGLGHLFRWRYARPLLQAPLLIVSVAMILHGLFGPTLAPKNLATTLSWLHFRGLLVLVLLCCGEFFLPGLSVYAGAPDGATILQTAIQLAAGAAQQVVIGGALRSDLVCLRAVRPVVVALVDSVADHCLLSHRARGGWPFQARFVLQVCLPHRTVQLCGLNAFSFGGEGARTRRVHHLPHQGLHSRPPRAGL